MKTLILGLTCIASSLAWSIPETDYQRRYEKEISPHFESYTRTSFQGVDNKRVNYFYKMNPKNTRTLVIAPGRTEPAFKYAEIAYDFKDAGVNIFLIDHRGQGISERMIKDTQKSYVREFDDYVQDFTTFMNIVKEKSKGRIDLIAHSMGGAISAYYIDQNPQVFTKVAFSAPMFEINTQPYSEKVASVLSEVLVAAGQGTKYAPGRGPYIPAEDTFEKNEYTHSLARFEMTKNIYVSNPQTAMGGPSSRWVRESLRATKNIHKLQNIPSILFQAELDTTVKPGRQNKYCHTNCKIIPVKGAFHEILMEKDAIRDPVMNKIRSFFELSN